ncbi:hypothetical protein K474DRAFT_1694167 [Panus rudis PR-1116 ss-1]|nr:hypothetical protein K474DRAFT_1694167 [Panus rudis PR-1116 ss-1]
MYFVCVLICIHLYMSRSIRRTRQNRVILWIILAMFTLAAAHLACSMQQLCTGLFRVHPPHTPESYFNNRALGLNLAIKSLNAVSMLFGDGLMLFRLWIIYEGNTLVMVLPVLTTLATAAVLFALNWTFAHLTPTQNAFSLMVKRLATAAFILPVVTNILITGLILYRIIQARAAVRKLTSLMDDNIYRTVVFNIVESCLIYPVFLTVAMILYLCKTNGQDVLSSVLPQVVGIVSTMLWVLVYKGASRYDAAEKQRMSNASSREPITFGHQKSVTDSLDVDLEVNLPQAHTHLSID